MATKLTFYSQKAARRYKSFTRKPTRKKRIGSTMAPRWLQYKNKIRHIARSKGLARRVIKRRTE